MKRTMTFKEACKVQDSLAEALPEPIDITAVPFTRSFPLPTIKQLMKGEIDVPEDVFLKAAGKK